MLKIIVASVLKLEPLRQVEIELNGAQLPYAADRVLDLDIDLRPVKGRFALDSVVRDAALFQCAGKLLFGGGPILIRTKITFILGTAANRQLEFHLVETV